MIRINMIKNGYTAEEVLVLLLNTDSDLEIQDIEEVYYPYIRFRYLITDGKERLAKKLKKLSDCVVDRIAGTVYISEGEPDFEQADVDEDHVLDIMIPLHESYDIGHSFTLKQCIGKTKLALMPQIHIIEESEFYKKFYVVQCCDEDELPYFIFVDAVDGGISVPDHEKYGADL